MRFRISHFTACFAILAILAGCQGPIMSGGYNQSPYRSYGVDGPGPGVIPEEYRPTSYQAPGTGDIALMGGEMESGPMIMPAMMPPMGPTSQVKFIGLEGLVIYWDAKVPGTFDSEPCTCPASHDFGQGKIYRLKLSSIPGYAGQELYPTLEIAPTMARTQAFLAHNSIPIEFTGNDFDQVFSGNFITKVIYLPNPEYQGLAMAGVGTLVNTQLEPGVDPIVEASNRGAILAVIRMGNKDLSGIVAERQRMGAVPPFMMGAGPAYPVNGSSIPQNMISGVNIPAYGTPMTKTTSGIPGPPQLPQGMHSPSRYPVLRTEPIPAPPAMQPVPRGVDPQNVVVHPHYTSQMQMKPQPQQQPSGPTLAPTPLAKP